MATRKNKKKSQLHIQPSIILFFIVSVLSILFILKFCRKKPFLPQKKSDFVEAYGIRIPSGYAIHGIDISVHQGNVNWDKIAAATEKNIKIDFVIIKATEGITRQDLNFKKNWQKAAHHSFKRGAYHFFLPRRDARKQAENYINTVNLEKGDIVPIIDVEKNTGISSQELIEKIKTFITIVENHYNAKPIIYTNINFYNVYLNDKFFKKYPLWISCYFEHDRFYKEFKEPWVIWQHSEKGTVKGVGNHVDFNVFNGSVSDFEKLCIP